MLKFLTPKGSEFFDLFDQLAACAAEAAEAFLEMVEDFGDAPAKAQRIRRTEHHADDITHSAIEKLHTTFVTPLDREQIHTLVSRMDDVIDLLDCSARRLILYGVRETTAEVRQMARVLRDATLAIQKAVGGLRNLKSAPEIREHCVQINKLENDGDALRDATVAKLFREQTDAIEILKWKEIYEDIEEAIDRCEDVANVIEGVLLENA